MSNDKKEFDFLSAGDTFNPPEPEYRLRQFSEKLVFSMRAFPEWMAAIYGVFNKKYEGVPIDTASKLLQLIIQDYIKQNYQLLGEQLPPTEESIDFLIRKGFVNPDSKSQFRKLSKASQKATEYEAEALSSGSLKQQYEYYKNRDPEKAEQIMEQMTEELVAGMQQPDEQEEDRETARKDSSNEEVIQENRSGFAEPEQADPDEDGIASLDYLDDLETEEED